MSLELWLQNSWLVTHSTSKDEIRNLLALADRDLADAGIAELSTDRRFNISYNAAHQLAIAALAAAGYRVARGGSHHHYAIQSLEYTVGISGGKVRILDRFRKKRNLSEYDAAGVVSELEAGELEELATDLRRKLEEWLRSEHPDLI
jgi:hypothetical protein